MTKVIKPNSERVQKLDRLLHLEQKDSMTLQRQAQSFFKSVEPKHVGQKLPKSGKAES